MASVKPDECGDTLEVCSPLERAFAHWERAGIVNKVHHRGTQLMRFGRGSARSPPRVSWSAWKTTGTESWSASSNCPHSERCSRSPPQRSPQRACADEGANDRFSIGVVLAALAKMKIELVGTTLASRKKIPILG